MLKLSVKLFRSALKINIFVIVQLTLVFLICIFMVSSVYSRLEYYLPLKNILNQKASAVTFRSDYTDRTNNKSFLLDYKTSPLKDELLNTDEVYERYAPYVNNEDRTLSVYSYDDSTIDLFTPDMKAGKWLDSAAAAPDSVIPAVICQNNLSYDIGDAFSGTAKTYENEDIDVNFKIIGILNDDSKIFGGCNQPLNNHLSFYSSPAELFSLEKETDEPFLMAVVPNRIINELNIVAHYDTVNAFVTYDDNTADKEAVLNTSELALRYGTAENAGTIKEKSLMYIKTQLYTLLPVVICIAVTALISSICTNAVITKKNIRKYVIFFLCGIRWNKCVNICLFNSLFTSLLSLAAAVIISLTAPLFSDINIIINGYSVLICLIIMIIYILLSLIIPSRILTVSFPKKFLS